MNITLNEFLVWLIVGALAGWAAGLVVKRKKEGFGRWTNLGIGLVGALIGGLLLNLLEFLFGLDLSLGELVIRYQDLLAAFFGSLIFLIGLWFFRRRRVKKLAPE